MQRFVNGIQFLGIRFADIDIDEAVHWVLSMAKSETFRYVITPNVDHAIMFAAPKGERWRTAYRDAVFDADLVVNDSRILQRLAKLDRLRLPVTPGSDLTHRLIDRIKGESGILLLVGGSPSEAAWLRAALMGYTVFHHEPPMGVRDSVVVQAEIARQVEAIRADIVLFAIGAPQSEIVAHQIAERGRSRGVALCIGASVEFLTGAKKRAPQWMQHAGLEWLFRLVNEPRRLWRRYLVDGPQIFRLWWRYRSEGKSD